MRNAFLILFCLLATNMLDFLMCISIWGIWWVHTIKSRWCICPWQEIKWKERWTELERTSQDSNSGRLNRNHAMCNLKIGLLAMLYRRAYEPARLSLCRWSRTQQHVCSSSPTALQSAKDNLCHTPSDLATLAPTCDQNQIWGFDAGFQNCHWKCASLTPIHS